MPVIRPAVGLVDKDLKNPQGVISLGISRNFYHSKGGIVMKSIKVHETELKKKAIDCMCSGEVGVIIDESCMDSIFGNMIICTNEGIFDLNRNHFELFDVNHELPEPYYDTLVEILSEGTKVSFIVG
jgi:hypothetical protein